jgi:hypothetical protein
MPLAGNRLVRDMSVCHSKKTFLGADTTQLVARTRSLGRGVNGRVIHRDSRLPTYPPPEEIQTRLFG